MEDQRTYQDFLPFWLFWNADILLAKQSSSTAVTNDGQVRGGGFSLQPRD